MPRAATRYLRKPHPRSPQRKQRLQPSSSGEQKQARKALKRSLADKPLALPLQDSDDSDKLVVVKHSSDRTGSPQNEVYLSGAIGRGDQPGSHPTRAQRRKQITQALKGPQDVDSAQNQPQKAATMPSAPASAARPRIAQSTPSRENSVLDGIKHRKRQHSILRLPQQGDSTLDLTNDSFALPDDESTPLHASKARAATKTQTTPALSTLASKKRKLGSSDPIGSVFRPSSISHASAAIPTPEPTLPPHPLSALRASGQKQRQQFADQDNDNIMAPPASSSSLASPAKSKTPATKTRTSQHPTAILTEDLQALMPTKRRKTARNRNDPHPDFDIPEDSDSPHHIISDPDPDPDSSFLPTKRNPKRTRRRDKETDPFPFKSSTVTSKLKKSKTQPTRTAIEAKAPSKSGNKTSTRLTLSRSAGNQGTKSPSQHSTSPCIGSLSSDLNGGTTKAVGVGAGSSGRAKRSGGSPLKASVDEKENLGEEQGEVEESEVLVQRSDNERDDQGLTEKEKEKQRSPKKTARSKWDEIDAWDMEFEEVEVWERSSEKDAR